MFRGVGLLMRWWTGPWERPVRARPGMPCRGRSLWPRPGGGSYLWIRTGPLLGTSNRTWRAGTPIVSSRSTCKPPTPWENRCRRVGTPLDLTVVPAQMRKGRIDSLKGMLPAALFPDYVGPNAKAPQTSTILRKTLECLLTLNYHLPAQIQANIFCIENLLLDDQWRELAVGRLPARDQKWWNNTYPMVVGAKGSSSAALKPALNALEQWKTQDRVQALLGASQSTVRWRDIIDGGKILLVVLNNDGSETDNLLARLIVGEMITAFKERSLTHRPGQPVSPFHLFLDEFQSYASVLEAHAEVFVQELRKFGAKVHFINQSPGVLSAKMREIIIANRTHLFAGRLGSPADGQKHGRGHGRTTTPRPTRRKRSRTGRHRRTGPAGNAQMALHLPGHPKRRNSPRRSK